MAYWRQRASIRGNNRLPLKMHGLSFRVSYSSTTASVRTWALATRHHLKCIWSMESRKKCGEIKFMASRVLIMNFNTYLCVAEQTVWAKAYASASDLRLNAPSRGNQSYRTNRPGLRMSSMTAVSTKAVGCETCVYWFSMAFTTLSTVSAYEEEKCLVRSGKDSMWRYLAKYLHILCHLSLDTLPFIFR